MIKLMDMKTFTIFMCRKFAYLDLWILMENYVLKTHCQRKLLFNNLKCSKIILKKKKYEIIFILEANPPFSAKPNTL